MSLNSVVGWDRAGSSLRAFLVGGGGGGVAEIGTCRADKACSTCCFLRYGSRRSRLSVRPPTRMYLPVFGLMRWVEGG